MTIDDRKDPDAVRESLGQMLEQFSHGFLQIEDFPARDACRSRVDRISGSVS